MAEQGGKQVGKSASRRAPRLGRGLSALVGPGAPVRVETERSKDTLNTVQNTNITSHDTTLISADGAFILAPIDRVLPNPHQPRRVFDERSLEALADSIRADGVMQPVVVRKVGDNFELVAGERRLRASKLAGLTEIPAILRDVDDRASAELALIENLQRADLNPVERAQAFRALIDRHGLTQAQLGERLGMDRTTVTNHLRLLELGDETLELIATGSLGFAHGRALAGVADGQERYRLAKAAIEEGWSARKLEREVASHISGTHDKDRSSDVTSEPSELEADDGPTRARAVLDDMEKRLGEHLGTRVSLKTNPSGQQGSMTISFFSLDEFDGILDRLGYRSARE